MLDAEGGRREGGKAERREGGKAKAGRSEGWKVKVKRVE
jgi:hypothetical protein